MDWELGVNRCKLLLWEWISNEILLCSTENYVQSLMMEHDNVRKKECIHVCVTGPPCCTVGKKLQWGNNNKKIFLNNYCTFFQSAFPMLPMPQVTLLLCFSSHKYPKLLVFREVDLRPIFPSSHLPALRINPSLLLTAASQHFVLLRSGRRTWFGNRATMANHNQFLHQTCFPPLFHPSADTQAAQGFQYSPNRAITSAETPMPLDLTFCCKTY